MTANLPLVTIGILTRNRKDELLVALESCFAQEYHPLEILVVDDGSSDDTVREVKRVFPEVRLLSLDGNSGIAMGRNMIFHEAKGEYIVMIDDDAYFTDTDTVSVAVEDLRSDEQLAVVALPFVEFRGASWRDGGNSAGVELLRLGQDLRRFTGCAHAVRKTAVLRVGGYREHLFGWGEEKDLCLRLIDCGLRIAYGRGGPVVHLASARRDHRRAEHYAVRNTLIVDFLNMPGPYVLLRMVSDTVKLPLYGFAPMSFMRRVGYVLDGLAWCALHWRERMPVSKAACRKYRQYPSHSPEAFRGGKVPCSARRKGPTGV